MADHTQGLDLSSEPSVRFVDGLGSTLNGQMRDVENEVLQALDAPMDGGGKRVFVILDGLDFLLAALGADAGEALDMVGEIREVGVVYFNKSSIDERLRCVCHKPKVQRKTTKLKRLYSTPIQSSLPPRPILRYYIRGILPWKSTMQHS